jgi:MinD superfamily P-loop ATPase
MFELVVASGKGGTGKTSLVAALAELAGPSVLVDCDVDAANLHLIVSHETLETHDFWSGRRASIDIDGCTACGVCSEYCHFGAISTTCDPKATDGLRFSVDPLACEGCGLCVRLCPERVIAFEPVMSGQWFRSESDSGPFLHARLGIAQSNSGRLVSLLRQQSRETAESRGLDLILVDGPPGIGCPVIATLTNASYLLIVTEPSLSAVHDMERLADLAAHFRIKTGVCINKCDINREISLQIEKIASEQGLVFHGSIPYDPAFTEAQLRGCSYIKTGSGQGIDIIQRIWQSVQVDATSEDYPGRERFAV